MCNNGYSTKVPNIWFNIQIRCISGQRVGINLWVICFFFVWCPTFRCEVTRRVRPSVFVVVLYVYFLVELTFPSSFWIWKSRDENEQFRRGSVHYYWPRMRKWIYFYIHRKTGIFVNYFVLHFRCLGFRFTSKQNHTLTTLTSWMSECGKCVHSSLVESYWLFHFPPTTYPTGRQYSSVSIWFLGCKIESS